LAYLSPTQFAWRRHPMQHTLNALRIGIQPTIQFFSPFVAIQSLWARLLEGGYCHAPCACHDISAPIDLIPTRPFVRHYHDVSSYPCDSPYNPKPPDIIPIGPESDWIFETWPAAALRYICSWRLGFDFGIMFHTSYLRYLILESWLHISFCFHFTI
jgi:hypothetical protein